MLTRRHFVAATATLPLAAAFARPAFAATPPVYASDGVAINGFDPVAYFTEGAPVAGDPGITVDWEGVSLRFASAEFVTEGGSKSDIKIVYTDHKIGPKLKFVEKLQKYLAPKDGSGAIIRFFPLGHCSRQ